MSWGMISPYIVVVVLRHRRVESSPIILLMVVVVSSVPNMSFFVESDDATGNSPYFFISLYSIAVVTFTSVSPTIVLPDDKLSNTKAIANRRFL